MGSQSKRLRKLAHTELRRVIVRLVERAHAQERSVDACWNAIPSGDAGQCTAGGWTMRLWCMRHDEVTHWHMSATPHPPGRASTEAERERVSDLVLRAAELSGCETNDPVMIIVPSESSGPSGTSHWCWHDDGTEIDAAILRGLRRAVEILPSEAAIL